MLDVRWWSAVVRIFRVPFNWDERWLQVDVRHLDTMGVRPRIARRRPIAC